MSNSVKLTGTLREEICHAILAYSFDTKIEATEKARAEAGDLIYNVLYDETIQSAMNALPEGFLPCDDHFDFRHDGGRIHVQFTEEKRLANCDTYNVDDDAIVDRIIRSDAYKSYDALDRACATRRKEREARERQINGVLNSVTTVKRLLEVWPEVESFIPGGTAATNLPVLVPAQLNKALGLPPSPKE